MTCSGCSSAVERVLGKLGGMLKTRLLVISRILQQGVPSDKVQTVDINLDEKLVKVSSSLSKEEIFEALKKTGKEVKEVQ